MPLYEYRCEKCGKRTEVIQNFSEKPLKICPHCGERKLKKMASAPAIQFKGSGWYVTDYAKNKGGEGAKEPSSESASEKPSEAKPEAKSEAKEKKADKAEKAARKDTKKD